MNSDTNSTSTEEHGSAETKITEYTFRFSRYYSVMKWQEKYYYDSTLKRRRTYEEDFNMNCSWDPLITANGHRLQKWEEWKVWACPLEFLNKTIYIEWYWEFKCIDRWGAIVKRGNIVRVDIRSWIWDEWRINIEQNKVYNPWDRKWYILYDYV